MKNSVSTRADIITRRTYCRPLNEAGDLFETFEQVVDRVIGHQRWLWERAKGMDLNVTELDELEELRQIMESRQALPSGRTLWLGGTEVSRKREASQFNCSFLRVETVHDVVDSFWLLLQGCGVGFEPVVGTLSGFTQPVEIQIVRSNKDKDYRGHEENRVDYYLEEDDGAYLYTYHLTLGDSAEAWAKAPGKLLALKEPVDKIIIDLNNLRGPGGRLNGYGWLCSGDATISKALEKICRILNHRAGELLTRIDILDILNLLGTTLSSRRSAEIALMPVTDPEADEFIFAKKDFWLYDREHRQQSNNSLVFWQKPSRWELRYIFDRMIDAGGSEPGFINAQAAKARAAWFKGVNPCAEILLGNKSFCNLVTPNWGELVMLPWDKAERIIQLIARANYRQTCVNLKDGVLQDTWHELNDFLRLCGVGAAGIVKAFDILETREAQITWMNIAKRAAWDGALGMSKELGQPAPKAVTTVKPDGTLGKVMDTTEGVHRPLGRYIFNNVTFSKHDHLIEKLRAAGYRVFDKPFEEESVLVTLPVEYDDVMFTTKVVEDIDGNERVVEVNDETAVEQLERYKMLMDHYVDHNCSITVSYDPSEVPDIVDWILENWDSYVGVSWIFRNDPTKTAKDLGYAYLPQEVVTKEVFDEYVSGLTMVNFDGVSSLELSNDDDCSTGACPIR